MPNKGEWSELYVLLKLLGEGKLFAADSDLEKIQDVFYPIIKIIRQESISKRRDYVIDGEIKVIDSISNSLLLSVPIIDFITKSKELFEFLKTAKGSSFNISDSVISFLRTIDVETVKAYKNEKADINIVVHDLNTGLKPKLGFSIKSMLGKDSTLFNPSAGTNFIYKLSSVNSNGFDINLFKKKHCKNQKHLKLVK